MSAPLIMALPKGRSLGPVATLLSAAGMRPRPTEESSPATLYEALTGESRALIRHAIVADCPVDVLLLKPDDVPTYVEYGAADMGISGRDVLSEREVDVYQPVDLGVAKCRLVVAGKAGAPLARAGRMPRVATKFPRSAAAHFAQKGIQVEVVNVQGSVELAPLVGLADFIVDLVETGATLAQNGLEVKEVISHVSSLFVVNRVSYKLHADVVGPLIDALRAATTA
ncbi:MAG: ATP phosphoribosyltransferase [Polyangiaceae bacterium]|nr:ATP phosphoribosyltransferase [Polyangiaceae bacterium]